MRAEADAARHRATSLASEADATRIRATVLASGLLAAAARSAATAASTVATLRQEVARRRRDEEAAAAATRRVLARLDGQAALTTPPSHDAAPAAPRRPRMLTDEPLGWPARPAPGRRFQTLVALGRWPVRRADGSLIRHVERDDVVMTWYIDEAGSALVTPHPMAQFWQTPQWFCGYVALYGHFGVPQWGHGAPGTPPDARRFPP